VTCLIAANRNGAGATDSAYIEFARIQPAAATPIAWPGPDAGGINRSPT